MGLEDDPFFLKWSLFRWHVDFRGGVPLTRRMDLGVVEFTPWFEQQKTTKYRNKSQKALKSTEGQKVDYVDEKKHISIHFKRVYTPEN